MESQQQQQQQPPKEASSSSTEEYETLLKSTWFSFLHRYSSDDCRHIYGFDDEPNHKLSMLQRITAKRIIDYETIEPPSTTDITTFQTKHGPPLDLFRVIQSQHPKMSLAAEFKRASPSKGDINPTLQPSKQALLYSDAGASIISILTEDHWFKGSLEDLTSARLATSSSSKDRPAILRKDFLFCETQIAEAASAGADTVLLIVAILPAPLLRSLIQTCREFRMEPLVEIHAPAELEVALKGGAKVLGVNNRNLHTFEMDMSTTDRTAECLEKMGKSFRHGDEEAEYALCALSGMSSAMDVDRYRNLGVGMVLIGESLMRSEDPSEAIRSLCLDPEEFRNLEGGGGGSYTKGM